MQAVQEITGTKHQHRAENVRHRRAMVRSILVMLLVTMRLNLCAYSSFFLRPWPCFDILLPPMRSLRKRKARQMGVLHAHESL